MVAVKETCGYGEQIQEIMALEGIHSSVEDITITTGSQHGLELVSDLFLDQGDVVLVEAPSYVGAVGIFPAQRSPDSSRLYR